MTDDVVPRFKPAPEEQRRRAPGSTLPTRRARISFLSDRRKAKQDAWQTAKVELRGRSYGRCELPTHADGCWGYAHHAHHVTPRSLGGGDELGNLLHVSEACHRWIHLHPKQAALMGALTIRP